MSHRPFPPALLVLPIAALATSCFSIGPDYSPPTTDVNPAWAATSEAAMQGSPSPAPEWWRVFNDPVLQGLIDEALAQNLSLENAALRVLQAKVGRRVRYQLLAPIPLSGGGVTHVNLSQNVSPEVEISGAPKKTDGPKTITIGGGPLHPEGKTITLPALDISVPSVSVSDELDIYEVGLDAIWELDFWGKKRRGITAADDEVDAAFGSYADTLVSLAGEVASTYVQLRTYEDRKRTLLENVALQRKNLDLSQKRKDAGAVSELDVVQLQSLLYETESLIPQLDASIHQARSTLCMLIGKTPGSLDDRLDASAPIPTAPEQIALGIPADLLRRRADVRSAERSAAAACERIGMAKTELYPQFSLVGSIGLASSHSNELFDSDSGKGAYGAGVKWNILLYTVIMDAVRNKDAEFQEALYDYQLTVLRAAKEVEDNADGLVASRAQFAKLSDSLAAEKRAVEISSLLYEKGKADLSRLLDAQRELTRIQDSASQVQGSIALRAIALYKALGGGWENIDPDRIIHDSTWKAMEARTDWDWYKPEPPKAGSEPEKAGG